MDQYKAQLARQTAFIYTSFSNHSFILKRLGNMRVSIICSIACAMLVLQAEAQAQPAAITGKVIGRSPNRSP
jgi:hypothetical protein